MFFDISTCLEGQTTSESCETRTVVSVSKIASQRFKNHIDPTSVLREKPRKPKGARRKRRNDDAWPSPEPPNRGAWLWGSAIAEPRRREGLDIGWSTPPGPGDPLQGPPTVPFDDVLRRFYMFGGSNDLRILRNKHRCVHIEDNRLWGSAIAKTRRCEGSAIGWPTPQGQGTPCRVPRQPL